MADLDLDELVEVATAAILASKRYPIDISRPNAADEAIARAILSAVLPLALAGAREDTARLDWLDSVNLGANERNGTVYGWRYDINHNRAALTDHNIPAFTVREAIDAARFPDREGEIRLNSIREQAQAKAFDEKYPGVREQARARLARRK